MGLGWQVTLHTRVTPRTRLQKTPSHTGTPPHRAPHAVPRIEPNIAQDIGVKSMDFGVESRDWTENRESGKITKRGDAETKKT